MLVMLVHFDKQWQTQDAASPGISSKFSVMADSWSKYFASLKAFQVINTTYDCSNMQEALEVFGWSNGRQFLVGINTVLQGGAQLKVRALLPVAACDCW